MSLTDALVLVVGAGPTGLTMASELARHGVPCRIVDRNEGPVPQSRVVAIHARTLEVFAGMGVLDSFLAIGHRIRGLTVFAEGQRVLTSSFDKLPTPYPFALDLVQNETERLLLEHLGRFGIQPEYNVCVTGLDMDEWSAKVYATGPGLEQRVTRVPYVVGCDGAQSTVRHLAGIPFAGGMETEGYVVADLRLHWGPPDDEWSLWFHEDGLFGLFPLGGDRYRMIAETGEAEPRVTADAVRRLFEHRGPNDSHIEEIDWLSSFGIAKRKVTTYQRGRILVAGDAAHVQSPAGSQGMNTGIQDAYNLAWKMAMVLRGNAPESLLESYTLEREPVARSVVALSDNINTIASLRNPVSQAIRNRIMPVLASFDALEGSLVERVAELSVNYRRSPIVGQSGRWYTAVPMPGDRAMGLFDLLQGTQHVVLLFTGSHPDPEVMRSFGNIERYMREGYARDLRTYLIAVRDVPWSGSKILDQDQTIHRAYSAAGPCVYLIRPDGYVGFRSLSPDPLPLLEHLNRVYEPPMKEA